MKMSEKLLQAVAIVIALFGLLIILGSILVMTDPKSNDAIAGDIALLIFAGIVPLALAVWLFVRTRTGAARRVFEARELAVLHLAGQHQGVLTVAQVAEQAGMTLEQAKDVLDRMHRKSFNEMSVSDAGEMLYTFHV